MNRSTEQNRKAPNPPTSCKAAFPTSATGHAPRAVAALEEELHACGLDGALPYLRADVNVFGVGVIELGRITPETAYAITTLLAQARTARDDTRKGSAA